MKRCPTCQRAYADESLSFCLEDGALLISEGPSSAPGASFDPQATLRADSSGRSQAPTEFLDARSAPTDRMPETAETMRQQAHRTEPDLYGSASSSPPPKTQNTALVVGLTVVATLILIALGGIGAWLFLREDKPAGNGPAQELNRNGANVNREEQANTGGVPRASAAPSPAANATPTPVPVNAALVREQVTGVLNGWTSASRARDLDKHMSYYADTLETYYSASNVGSSRVRADRERAYALYNTLDVELTDIKITPDPSGERATATFDKTWTFEGNEKYSSGSVHQRVWLAKIGGRWRIVGEKDLKVYYVNRER